MKKNFILLAVAFFSVSAQLSALSLVHYWNFNGTNVPISAEVKSMDVVTTPLSPIQADSSMTTTRATLIYRAKTGTASPFMSYWDTSTGSTGNARNGDAAGNCLRPRDAWSSMELVLNIPSTGIQNLKIMYEVQRSGSGPNVNTYSYSVDGGTNWIKTGLNVNGKGLGTDTISTIPSGPFAIESITITDPAAENNDNLKFRIWFSDPTNKAGNNRIDNITVEGDALTSAIGETKINKILMYPNPCKTGKVNFSDAVDVEVLNMTGKQIKSVSKTNKLITTDLVKGVYLVRLNGVSTQKLVVE
ncbi:MAG: T9SS type A sorting domain-containing protein [Bacteroidales bacterium]